MGESHLRLLCEMLELCERYRLDVSRSDLDHDREAWLKVRAALETAASCAIDLALQMIAARGLRPPSSYREAFAALARAGLISSALATELERWAGLRNVLAHVYTSLDLDQLHAALGQTAPLQVFARVAERALTDEP